MFKVLGSGLDSLIAAKLLLDAGHEVTQFSNSQELGGHFRGMKSCESHHDMGMVLLEPDFGKESSKNLESYDGEFGRDSRRYLSAVFSWLESEIGILKDHSVFSLLPTNVIVPDYFIGDNLEFLKTLSESQRLNLVSRISTLFNDFSIRTEFHPSKRFTSQLSKSKSLSEFLIFLYGYEIYKFFFEGFFEKVTGELNSSISIKDNRRVWMPNYYPESIFFELTKNPRFLEFEIKPIHFLRPESSQIAEFVNSMRKSIEKNVNYRLVNLSENDIQFDFNDKSLISFLNLSDLIRYNLINLKQIECFQDFIQQEKEIVSNKINITHFCVSHCDPKTVFIAEKSNQILRYSYYQSNGKSVASTESISGLLESLEASRKLIESHGLDTTCKGNNLQVPLRIKETSFTNSEWNEFIILLKSRYKSLNSKMFLIHPEANTFNDNVLRGLVAFEKRF